MTAILVADLGISALDIHAKRKKHLLKCPAKTNQGFSLHHPRKKRKRNLLQLVSQSINL